MSRLIAAATVAGMTLILSACGSSEPDTFTASGTIREKGVYSIPYGELSCDGGRSTLEGSPQIIIKNGSGTDLGFGNIKFVSGTEGTGVKEKDRYCDFSFAVSNIPTGESVYQIVINGIEAPRATEQELRAGLSLSYG